MAVTPQTNASLAQIANVISASDDFVICGHVSPDGDCLGCQLTLWHALRVLGKRATCVLVKDEPVGAALAFLPGIEEMIPASEFKGVCKTFVGVDVPTRERIGDVACVILDSADTSITIDHHASDTTMCDYVHVDPDAASASILVWEVVKLLLQTPPLESAVCAYTGLVTDTGGFRFQNSDARAFNMASEFVAYGVDPAFVATNAFQNRTLASLKLESAVIERLEIICEGKASISWVREDDLKRVGATKADVEPLIDTVRAVQGTRVACMLREQDGEIRGNLRSKDDTDVSALARQLGGGGHKAAAGFNLEMPLVDAVEFMKGKLAGLVA